MLSFANDIAIIVQEEIN